MKKVKDATKAELSAAYAQLMEDYEILKDAYRLARLQLKSLVEGKNETNKR